MKLSVIISTFNRNDKLQQCLEALWRQDLEPELFEVLIVDDGSWSQIQMEYLKTIPQTFGNRFSVLPQPHRGPAATRNAGIKRADGEVVLFLGDDIVCPPSLLKAHFLWHQKNPESHKALQGKVIWKDAEHVSLLMQWLDEGWQFNFQELPDFCETDFWHFCTAQVSLKKQFLFSFGFFNEKFPAAAFEDTELAYRLSLKGMKLYYSAHAVAFHDHPTSFLESCNRSFTVGRSFNLFASLHPEIPVKMAHVEAMSPRMRIQKFRDLLFNRKNSLHRKCAKIVGFFFFKPVMKFLRKCGQIFP